MPDLQCEDERFELDMLIEAGGSTIRLLDLMAQDISELDGDVSVRRMPPRDRSIYLSLNRSTCES